MINPQCVLCQRGIGMEEGRSQREVAAEHGVGKSSVGRHRAHYATPAPGTAAALEGFSVERLSVRDPDTGSWTKYRAAPPDVTRLDAKDIEAMFRTPLVAPPPTFLREHTEVLAMSDLQIGKAGERSGGTKGTIARARASVAKFVERCERSQPATILLIDGGDGIENVFNTPRQMVTNDMDVVEQVRTARRLFAEAIRAVAPLAPDVRFASVPSNHGEFRTGYKTPGGTTDADFGLEINYALEEIFEGRENTGHIQFIRTEPLDDTVVVEASDTKLAVNHGYHSKGIHKHGEWWAKQDHGRRTGWDADILLMSHYHTFSITQSGNARWIISASSADPGSEWFSKMTGESSQSGMTAFAVQSGMWSDITIL